MGIVEIGSIVSALLVIMGVVFKLFNVMHKTLDKLDEFEATQKRNEMHIMKLGLFSDSLPLEDRIQCGKRYLELGGNGTGKIQYGILIKKMEVAIDKHFNYDNSDAD